MKTLSLEGKTALLTGSSRGIGRAIALAMADAGAVVRLHGLETPDVAESVRREVGARGPGADFLFSDLAEEGGGRALAEAALAAGPVDILVLCASIQILSPWAEITPEDTARQIRVNFQATLELIQTLVPPMQNRGWGRLLTIGSVQEVLPHPQMAVYAAMKAAQTSLVLNLAKQLAPDGVTCNNLAPGVIRTDRNAKPLSEPGTVDRVRRKIPLGAVGEPEDCAGAALLLCSDAGRYITGHSLYVDGGLSL
ncbi:MAG: SDR family oxidoreductase [Verrucomicrobiota bacterium]